jgi:aldose 1-epimerase
MKFFTVASLLALSTTVSAGIQQLHAEPQAEPLPVGPDGKYTLVADGIRAQFIPYGASITNLFVNDSRGVERDIVLGYDNARDYELDRKHYHLGGVPGRYANRIKNG